MTAFIDPKIQTRALSKSSLGSTMFQAVIQKPLQDVRNSRNGIFATLPSKPGSGDAAYINRRTAGNAKFVGETDLPTYTVGGALTMDDGGYTQVSFPYKTVLTYGQITRAAIARGRGYADVLAEEMRLKTLDFVDDMEGFLAVSKVSATAFDGLIELAFKAGAGQRISPAGAVKMDLDLVLLDKVQHLVKGGGTHWLMSKVASRILNGILQAQQAFNDKVTVNGGFQVATYGGLPIILSDGIPEDMLWNATTATLVYSGETANPTTAIVLVNTDYVWLEELTPMEVVILPAQTSQFQAFEMYWDGVPVLANPRGIGLILGIDSAE